MKLISYYNFCGSKIN